MTTRTKFRDIEVKIRQLIWQLQEARDLEGDPEIARKLNQAASHLWVADDIVEGLDISTLTSLQQVPT